MADNFSIESYLRGLVAYEVPNNALSGILYKRGIPFNSPIDSIELRLLELCEADLYMWCAKTPMSKSSSEDSDGDWKHTDGGWKASETDKSMLRESAKAIYLKYGEKIGNRVIRIVNL